MDANHQLFYIQVSVKEGYIIKGFHWILIYLFPFCSGIMYLKSNDWDFLFRHNLSNFPKKSSTNWIGFIWWYLYYGMKCMSSQHEKKLAVVSKQPNGCLTFMKFHFLKSFTKSLLLMTTQVAVVINADWPWRALARNWPWIHQPKGYQI